MADERRDAPDDRALRELGITARPVSAYVRELVLASEATSAGDRDGPSISQRSEADQLDHRVPSIQHQQRG